MWRLQNGPRVPANIQDADDLNMSRKHPITNERLLNHNGPQIRKNCRFNPVAAAGIFSDGYSGGPDLGGDGHFNPPPKLAPEVSANISPVFPGHFR
jgi:hypothetical protein